MVERPYRMPFMRTITVILIALIVIATLQLILPGVGDVWFGSSYAPDGWAPSQKWVYLLTELVPVLVFAAIGVLFWWLGRKTRADVLEVPAEAPAVVLE
jgi:hypothetical protein